MDGGRSGNNYQILKIYIDIMFSLLYNNGGAERFCGIS